MATLEDTEMTRWGLTEGTISMNESVPLNGRPVLWPAIPYRYQVGSFTSSHLPCHVCLGGVLEPKYSTQKMYGQKPSETMNQIAK